MRRARREGKRHVLRWVAVGVVVVLAAGTQQIAHAGEMATDLDDGGGVGGGVVRLLPHPAL